MGKCPCWAATGPGKPTLLKPPNAKEKGSERALWACIPCKITVSGDPPGTKFPDHSTWNIQGLVAGEDMAFSFGLAALALSSWTELVSQILLNLSPKCS